MKKIAIVCGIILGIPILLAIGYGVASAVLGGPDVAIPIEQSQPVQSAPSSGGGSVSGASGSTSIGVNGNPWGYDFNSSGSLIYSPNSSFCQYFTCVSTFWTDTRGYVAECSNGSYTHSGGVSGACSRDGGVKAVLYSH